MGGIRGRKEKEVNTVIIFSFIKINKCRINKEEIFQEFKDKKEKKEMKIIKQPA